MKCFLRHVQMLRVLQQWLFYTKQWCLILFFLNPLREAFEQKTNSVFFFTVWNSSLNQSEAAASSRPCVRHLYRSRVTRRCSLRGGAGGGAGAAGSAALPNRSCAARLGLRLVLAGGWGGRAGPGRDGAGTGLGGGAGGGPELGQGWARARQAAGGPLIWGVCAQGRQPLRCGYGGQPPVGALPGLASPRRRCAAGCGRCAREGALGAGVGCWHAPLPLVVREARGRLGAAGASRCVSVPVPSSSFRKRRMRATNFLQNVPVSLSSSLVL